VAQTKVVIVYSPNQNLRRTVIIPDDDSQISIHTANILPGEAVLVGSLADYISIGPDAMLMAYTGRQPSSDRCMVISNDNVVAVFKGDPLIDTHPLGEVVADVTGKAMVGATYKNNVLTQPTPIIDAQTGLVTGYTPVSVSVL
jgi:hypothetical protein